MNVVWGLMVRESLVTLLRILFSPHSIFFSLSCAGSSRHRIGSRKQPVAWGFTSFYLISFKLVGFSVCRIYVLSGLFGPCEAGYGVEPLDYFVCRPMFGLLYILYTFRVVSGYYLPLVNIRMFYFLEVLHFWYQSLRSGLPCRLWSPR